MSTAITPKGTPLSWALGELLGALPERRDWLNPEAEAILREALSLHRSVQTAGALAGEPTGPRVAGADLDLRDLGRLFADSQQSGRPVTLSASACGVLLDAMTTGTSAPAGENLALVIARLEQIRDAGKQDDTREMAEQALVCARAVASTTPAAEGADASDFGQQVTRLVNEIRKPCSMAWRDSLVEQLIELIDPQPEGAQPSPEPADTRPLFEAAMTKRGHPIRTNADGTLAGMNCYRWEGWEAAMSTFTPCVKTDIGDAESLIPPGWLFLTADFSMLAEGKRTHGSVTLIRDAAGRAEFHALPDGSEARKEYCLYANGRGSTLREAIANAAAILATGSAA